MHKPENYIFLFELSGLPFFGNDTLLKNYAEFGVLFFFDGETWRSYFPKKAHEKTLDQGVLFYGDEKVFAEYEESFESYRKEAAPLFDRLVLQNSISSDEIERFLEAIIGVHTHYIKTEFFYSDKAFSLVDTNPVIKHNLTRLGNIKNPGREFINKIFFGNEGYIARIFSILEKQFGVPVDDLYYYSHDELKNLWQGTKLSEEAIAERKAGYLSDCSNGTTQHTFGSRVREMIKEFIAEKTENTTEIKGIIANKGKARGEATVLNVGVDNFDEIVKEIDAMPKGNILIAQTTSPELIRACHKASAIITNEGGMMSHAAIVSRELHIPCIVGTRNATALIKNGDSIEVDADQGIIRILKKGTR